MQKTLEIRKLPAWCIFQLGQILECGSDWKKLMAIIPKNGTDDLYNSKYKYEHFKLIELAGDHQKRPCAEIFLEEWGTSGRKQPDLATLLDLLVKAGLHRAAEYVAVKLLEEPAPERPLTGIAADVDVSDEAIQNIINSKTKGADPNFSQDHISVTSDKIRTNESQGTYEVPVLEFQGMSCLNVLQSGDISVLHERVGSTNTHLVFHGEENTPLEVSPVINQETLPLNDDVSQTEVAYDMYRSVTECPQSLHLDAFFPHYSYNELKCITNNFCERPLLQMGPNGGCKLGTGAFGSVFLGIFPSSKKVAVKRLKEDVINVERQFKNEVEALSRYQHTNLLSLLGYSCDGPAYCLVYEYMSNGSLQERLACQNSTPVLPWLMRLKIALGTSLGILHLHTAFEKPVIHRDIKSANILLDENLKPKLGDFGLVRLGVSGQQSQSVALTSTVFGTSAYMAPEAFRGDISVKLDSFSFGVVLLELLTSLPPYDEKREGCDLITHVEDICDGSIEPLLDTKAGTWGKTDIMQPSELFYSVALDCLKEKRHRPTMDFIVQCLQNIIVTCQ